MQTTQCLIRLASADEIRPLRRAILRAHQPPEESFYPGDDDPVNFHMAAYINDRKEPVAVATVFLLAPPDKRITENAWQLRGMAVAKEYQGQKIGSQLLKAVIAEIARRGGKLLWCNARTSAKGFYDAHGFTVENDEFEIEGIGPHYIMMRLVGSPV